MTDEERAVKHADTLYDYIKFHLGLYLATPPAMVIVATALGVEKDVPFLAGMTAMLLACLVSGAHASSMMAGYINTAPWTTDDDWTKFTKVAGALWRRRLHHHLYWLGLGTSMIGLVIAWSTHSGTAPNG